MIGIDNINYRADIHGRQLKSSTQMAMTAKWVNKSGNMNSRIGGEHSSLVVLYLKAAYKNVSSAIKFLFEETKKATEIFFPGCDEIKHI